MSRLRLGLTRYSSINETKNPISAIERDSGWGNIYLHQRDEINEMDLSHLNALEYSLHNESIRLREAKSKGEIELRSVWVKQLEKQIADEREMLGLADFEVVEMSDAELLAELGV